MTTIDTAACPSITALIVELGDFPVQSADSGELWERVISLSYEYIGHGQCMATIESRWTVADAWKPARTTIVRFVGVGLAWASPIAFALASYYGVRLHADADEFGSGWLYDPKAAPDHRTDGFGLWD